MPRTSASECVGSPRAYVRDIQGRVPWLRKKANEFLRIDVFGEGVRAGLNDAEELFGRYDREEVSQRRACDRRQE